MLALEDNKWKELDGGYRAPYDASVALKALQNGKDVWDELWEELHHQGDVGVASYAAVPQIVNIAGNLACRDWNFYGLIAIIEIERHRKNNPPIPEWLRRSYDESWVRVLRIASDDLTKNSNSTTLQAMLSVIALAKGELKLGALLAGLDPAELSDWAEERLAWAELYGV